MEAQRQTRIRQKRAQRFRSTKLLHKPMRQLILAQDALSCVLTIARARRLSLEEGKELIRLKKKVARLRKKCGLEESQEN